MIQDLSQPPPQPAPSSQALGRPTSAPAAAPVDVLIQTHNEELNLPHTLASVAGWANRIFVVDSGSTDRTAEIARNFGAEVIEHPWEGYAGQKNWALDHLPWESPWILILDADESVTPELRDEILNVVTRPLDQVRHSGFFLNRVLIFMGRQIRHCGYFPSWNLRLFRRGRARYEPREVHEHMIVQGSTGYLKHLMLHEDRRGLEHFFAKHNRYSTLEAREIFKNQDKWPGIRGFFVDRTARRRFIKSRVVPQLPMPWIWRLFYMYVLQLGFLDGQPGWVLCNLISSYEFFIHAKYLELRRMKGRAVQVFDGLSEKEGAVSLTTGVLPAPAEPESLAPSGNGAGARPPRMASAARSAAPSQQARPMIRSEPSPWTLQDKIRRACWMIVRALLFHPSFHNWYAWRRALLRVFGARIGRNVRIRPSVKVEIPWNLEIGEETVIGDEAILYSLGPIRIGQRVTISQYAHLCAGTHDHTRGAFPLLRPPITISDDVWIAADAFVGPGVTVGPRAVLGARASAFSDLPGDVIYVGNPARALRPRELHS